MALDNLIIYLSSGTSPIFDLSGDSTAGINSNFCSYDWSWARIPEESPHVKWWRWWNSRARSIDAILEIARNFNPVAKAVRLARRMFERRSDPRWGSARWKAKT